jgi:carbon monoxide dehydrogenase subunit G
MALEFTIEESIAAPPEAVFADVVDPEAMTRWMPAVVSVEPLTEGPLRVGSRFRETRTMFGKAASEVFEVTHLEAPSRLDLYVDGRLGSSKKGEYWFRHDFERDGQGTRLRLHGKIETSGFMMRMLGSLMRGMFKKAIAKDLRALKAHVEGARGRGGASGG